MEEEIKKAEEFLIKKDKKLAEIIKNNGSIFYSPKTNYFEKLCESIVSQQISVKAADTIYARFEAKTRIDPKVVSELTELDAREIGLSRQKHGYLKDLATHFVENPNIYNHLEKSSDEDVIKELTEIKGIGVWTAQMFLMSTLVRLDVFAPDDIGLQRAIKNIYGLVEIPKRKELEKFAEQWKPYRTVASWHLWYSLDNKK